LWGETFRFRTSDISGSLEISPSCPTRLNIYIGGLLQFKYPSA
jgi:hypothetical protein